MSEAFKRWIVSGEPYERSAELKRQLQPLLESYHQDSTNIQQTLLPSPCELLTEEMDPPQDCEGFFMVELTQNPDSNHVLDFGKIFEKRIKIYYRRVYRCADNAFFKLTLRREFGTESIQRGVRYTFFRLHEIEDMVDFLDDMDSFAREWYINLAPTYPKQTGPPGSFVAFDSIEMEKCDRAALIYCRQLCEILRESRLGQGIKSFFVTTDDIKIDPIFAHTDDIKIDRKLVRLQNSFPNLEHLYFSRLPRVSLPATLESLREFRLLSKLGLCGAVLTKDCLYNLADSIDNLPVLTFFALEGWVVCRDPEPGLEALFCSLGKHPKVRIHPYRRCEPSVNPQGKQYLGDPTREETIPQDLPQYTINQQYYKTFKNGPTYIQVLTQIKRQKLRQLGFPENNRYDGNLAIWVEALIAVKDIQMKGREWLTLFHFLFAQLGPEAYNDPELFGHPNPTPVPLI